MKSSRISPSLLNIIDRYTLVLLDAYGVLVTDAGPCPGAPELLAHLDGSAKPYLLLTNDASRLPEEVAARLRGFGMEVPVERIITSGSLLRDYFVGQGLQGSRCAVLGTAASKAYVCQAGGQLMAVNDAAGWDVLAVCSNGGFPFLKTVNAALTSVFKALDQGQTPHLVLPNPDLIFPTRQGGFGFTAGAIALIIERAIEVRYRELPVRFVPLGKPYPPMFERALALGGTRNMLMIGDQLATDILGAQNFGIDSLLVGQGVTGSDALTGPVRPTYVLASLTGS